MEFKFTAIKLSGLLIVVFLFQLLVPSIADYLLLTHNPFAEPWRYVSALFLHGGITHLLLNLFALLLFGSILEKFVGTRRFLLVFFVSGILANIISGMFYTASLGASGAIFGVIGALIVIRPLMVVWTYGMPMPLFLAGIVWAIADVLGTYGFFAGIPLDSTGNIAHLSGLFFGLLYGFVFRFQFHPDTKNSKERVTFHEPDVLAWERKYLR